MPPASSRSAATSTATVGRPKATVSKKSAQVSNTAKRKSIATDPALLQGSSDEDGEGPDDHEDEQQQASSKLAKHGSSSQKATSALSRTTKAQTPAVSSASNASPRRSTRLSGEGIGSQQQQQSSVEAAKGSSSQASRNSKAASSSQSHSTVPNKRKAPSNGRSGNAVNSTHPTPPETDSDTAQGRIEQSSQRKGSTQSQSLTSKAKKAKVASGEGQQQRRRAPSPPPSDGSDESDNFAFTRVGQATEGPVASSSKQAITETASQPLPSRVKTGSSRIATTSQSHPIGRSQNSSKTKPTSQLASSDLLQSLKEVRQNGTNKATTPAMASKPPAKTAESAVVDRKGKRKADDSGGEDQEEARTAADANSQSSRTTQVAKGTKSRLKKGRVAELSREDLDDTQQPNQPPDPGTPGRTSKNIPVNTQETPAIQRNLAMRAGLGNGAPPGTPGSSRRSSGELRGRRGSSIGNGLEALPHPSLPSNTLYRHIKADDPQPVRFRTLVTWSAHRLKEAMESETRTASAAVRAAASSVMDSLIADLVEKRIDLSWQAVDPADDSSTKKLPPNPENQANQAKLEACQAWIKRLQEEDQARNLRINQYKSMTERITKLMTPLPPLPGPFSSSSAPSSIPDLLQPNWSLPIPRFSTTDDMLAYGKKLLQPKPSTTSTRRKSAAAAAAAAANNEESNSDPNIVKVQEEYPIDYDEIKHQAASMTQSAYRINQFLKLADTFITQHLSRTQIQLSQHVASLQSGNAGASGGNSRVNASAKGKSSTASEEDASTTTRALLAGSGSQAGQLMKNRGQDAMSLLRAISRADTSKKK